STWLAPSDPAVRSTMDTRPLGPHTATCAPVRSPPTSSASRSAPSRRPCADSTSSRVIRPSAAAARRTAMAGALAASAPQSGSSGCRKRGEDAEGRCGPDTAGDPHDLAGVGSLRERREASVRSFDNDAGSDEVGLTQLTGPVAQVAHEEAQVLLIGPGGDREG